MDMLSFPGASSLMNAGSQNMEANIRNLQQRSELADGEEKALRKVSKDMESLFVKLLLDSMDKTVPRGEDSWDNSQAMQTWRGMLNEQLSGQLGESSPIGLAEIIFKQLSVDSARHKEVPPAAAGQSPPAAADNAPTAAPQAPQAPEKAPSHQPYSSATQRVRGLRGLIERTAGEEGVDPALVAAMITQESGGNPEAVSPAGARGLMQLMPATARMLGVEDVFDPQQNVSGGVRYISQLMERFGGDEKLALAAYNAGPGTVDRYGGVPPYRETTDYVKRVSLLKSDFRRLGFGPRSMNNG
jgi:Rod binding domain-containing protein